MYSVYTNNSLIHSHLSRPMASVCIACRIHIYIANNHCQLDHIHNTIQYTVDEIHGSRLQTNAVHIECVLGEQICEYISTGPFW